MTPRRHTLLEVVQRNLDFNRERNRKMCTRRKINNVPLQSRAMSKGVSTSLVIPPPR